MGLLQSYNCFAFVLALFIYVNAEYKITILHTNDCHSRIEQASKYGSRCSKDEAAAKKCYGGVARRKTALDKLRKENANTLFLDGGDQFQGSPWFELYNGYEAAYFMKKLEYDVMTLGNHEFDRGVANLGEFLRNVSSSFDVVSANTDASAEPDIQSLFKKSVVLDVGGQKIGVIGYTFKGTKYISQTGKVEFSDEVQAVQAEAKALAAQGVKILIGLGHAGYDTDKKVAELVPEIDAVVGGHSNTFLYTGKPPSNEEPEGLYPTMVTQASGRKVPVVQDFYFGKYLGVMHLTIDDNGEVTTAVGNPILLDAKIPEDPTLLAEVNEWGKPVEIFGSEVIGESYVRLNADCYFSECNLGNLITDAIVKMTTKKPEGDQWTRAAAAIYNGGGIRNPIKPGKVIRNDIISTLPFRNTVTQIDLKGADLRAAFEYNVEEYGIEHHPGRFLQVSGIHVTYNVKNPPGKRVMSLEILCTKCQEPKYEPVKDDVDYTILTSNFVRNGGSRHTIIRDKAKNEVEIGTLASDVLADYIKKFSPITYGTEGRIKFLEEGPVSSGNKVTCTMTTLCLTVLFKLFLN